MDVHCLPPERHNDGSNCFICEWQRNATHLRMVRTFMLARLSLLSEKASLPRHAYARSLMEFDCPNGEGAIVKSADDFT